jgi:hypothetical protein
MPKTGRLIRAITYESHHKVHGETAAKLRLVFDALAETRGVYLFDEVDA